MSKKNHTKYTSRERKAEKEIDAFLAEVHGPTGANIMHELELLAGS